LFMNGIGELKSCLFCDDIFAELADGTFMDAWLPEFIDDPSGMNLIVSRNTNLSAVVDELLENGIGEGKHISSAQIEASQLGVIEKKRSGLPFRCVIAARSTWVPQKRLRIVAPSNLEELEKAVVQLHTWETLRCCLAQNVTFLRNFGGFAIQFLAWFTCVRLYVRLRRKANIIYSGRSVFFMQNFRPRAMLRSLIHSTRSVRTKK
jgi:hypothetical protein